MPRASNATPSANPSATRALSTSFGPSQANREPSGSSYANMQAPSGRAGRAGRSAYGGSNPAVPLYAFVALCISAILYVSSWITWLAAGAKVFEEKNATHFLAVVLLANVAVLIMIAMDYFYVKYRFNWTALSVSLFYCATIGMMVGMLIYVAINGANFRDGYVTGRSLFKGNAAGIISWLLSALALCLQIAGYYYFG